MMSKKNTVAPVCRNLKVLVVSLLFIFKPLNFGIMSRGNNKNIPNSPISFKNSDSIKQPESIVTAKWGKTPTYNYLILMLLLFPLKITSNVYVVFMVRELDTLFLASYLFRTAVW